jgi:hypothetical protein
VVEQPPVIVAPKPAAKQQQPAATGEPAVKRHKKVGAYTRSTKRKLIYPFYPVPLVPGHGVRGKERAQVEEQIDALHAAMPHPLLLVYLKAARKRDSQFRFSMSAAEARRARGSVSKAVKGDPYLRLGVDSGLFVQELSGGTFDGQKFSSTYQLLPWSPEMQAKAMDAFAKYRQGMRNDPDRLVEAVRAEAGS